MHHWDIAPEKKIAQRAVEVCTVYYVHCIPVVGAFFACRDDTAVVAAIVQAYAESKVCDVLLAFILPIPLLLQMAAVIP